jgi:hypothetical protein
MIAYKVVAKRGNKLWSSNYGLTSYDWAKPSKNLTKKERKILKFIKAKKWILEYKKNQTVFSPSEEAPLLAFPNISDAQSFADSESFEIEKFGGKSNYQIWEVEVTRAVLSNFYFRIHPSYFQKLAEKKIELPFYSPFSCDFLLCNSIRLIRLIG